MSDIISDIVHDGKNDQQSRKAQKATLAEKDGMSKCQITNWLSNARRRHLPKMIESDSCSTSLSKSLL
ncbi:unnamed protein product [Oikopleura dioica]|uniref:KN homeodomain domain-containing protein n=1 Tax=Oikopleura dioica TaxID=34765 RepID=E4Y218_OIKDI|nr:unnamed protein product [Oikopleura dioica]